MTEWTIFRHGQKKKEENTWYARNIDKYKEFLSIADEPYTGSYDDGRGNL